MDGKPGDDLKERIRSARRKFAAMAATYFAGVLNDNFFRQSALLMAVTAGKQHLQGYATFVFTLPFILFAAPAGFCADRFPKRYIVITSKVLELVAMIFAGLGIYYLNWGLIMVTLFIMGLQSTLFGPSLNGSIPELYPAEYVVKANAIIRMVSTGAILIGIAVAGFVLDKEEMLGAVPLGRVVAATMVVGMSVIGVIVSFGVPRYPAASPDAKFPWRGPLDSVRTLWGLRVYSLLAITIGTKAFIWFIGSLEVQVINLLGVSQFGLSKTLTSWLIIVQLVGIAAGSILSARLAKGQRWYRVLGPAAIVMAVGLFVVALVPHLPASVRPGVLIATLGLAGMAGGVLLIPLASYVQVRPAAERKGRVIAAASFADFTGILLSGAVFYLLVKVGVLPSNCFAVMGIMMGTVGIWLFAVLGGKKYQ
jgi:acyl-[acyl-carrier-protein]-phospholipid O-acyltransferase/long-chain-fatty-acid--[acyl-carrier-protein] ligase